MKKCGRFVEKIDSGLAEHTTRHKIHHSITLCTDFRLNIAQYFSFLMLSSICAVCIVKRTHLQNCNYQQALLTLGISGCY